MLYSGTSDKGLSIKVTIQKNLCIKDKMSCPKLYFLPLNRGNLPIKDNLGQNELVPSCPLLRGFTVAVNRTLCYQKHN